MDLLRGWNLFSGRKPDELGEFIACEKTSLSEVTSRLPSPGSRVIIKTAENKELYLSREDLQLIKGLCRMAEDLGVESNGELTVSVPISLSSKQMGKVIAWCRHHSLSHPNPLELAGLVFPFTEVHELLEFIDVAQFLDIGPLAESLAQSVARLLEAMDEETARKALCRQNKTPCSPDQVAVLTQLKKIFAPQPPSNPN